MRVTLPAHHPQRLPDTEEHDGNHGELPDLYPDVEPDERRDELVLRQAEFPQHRGKTKPVQQTKAKDHQRSPRAEPCKKDILDRDIDDRGGDQRLDNATGDRHPAKRAKRQCHRMRCRKRGNLPDQRAQMCRQEK